MSIVTVILTNADRSRFVVQRKDEGYPYPRTLGLFGGHAEVGESDRQTLARELVEEMGEQTAAEILACKPSRVVVKPWGDDDRFVLFEAVMSDGALDEIVERPVFEGERAEIADLRDIEQSPAWIPGLAEILRLYVSRPSTRAPTRDPRP